MMQTSRAPQLVELQNAAVSMVYIAPAAGMQGPWPTVVVRMIELFDGTRTVSEVCSEVQISVEKGMAAVRKLNAKGLLRRVEPVERQVVDLERADTLRDLTPLPTSLPARDLQARAANFSAQEEAFFASEVSPIDACDEPFPTLRERIGLAFSDLLRCRATAA